MNWIVTYRSTERFGDKSPKTLRIQSPMDIAEATRRAKLAVDIMVGQDFEVIGVMLDL
jgi:hypothetical protein